MFLVLIEKFDQKSNFQPWLAWLGLMNWIWLKRRENEIFKSREQYSQFLIPSN